jgi:molybdopterin molybdotransferase
MIETTQQVTSAEIELLRAVSSGENVLQIGEDVRMGDVVIGKGVRLGSAEIGGLSALGYNKIAVTRQPRVAILSSGDEVVPPGTPLMQGQIYDINSYSLKVLVEEAGGIAVTYPIIRDDGEAFRESAELALAENDLAIFTAGSSVSVRDLTAQTIDALGKPGVLVHGVSVRPGKPTILAVCTDKPVIGLPGNPVSALVIARLFVIPVIEKLLGVATPSARPFVVARLTTNLASQAGREDWVPVRITPSAAGYDAEPVFGKSNLIFTLIRANGLLKIHPDANGIAAGEQVRVELL